MTRFQRRIVISLILFSAIIALLQPTVKAQSQARDQSRVREVTILYTNDFHSAVDPIPSYWLLGSPKLDGASHLASLINQVRKRDQTVFLFDTGDMFTGMLSFLTRGEALMEMMISMNYDAMAIGNHEFDYGADNFEKQMNRVPFPVLGANIFYKGTTHRYSRPYTNDQPVDDKRIYRVATNSFLTQGGDLYETFLRVKQQDTGKLLSDVVMDYFRERRDVEPPKLGRLIHIASAG